MIEEDIIARVRRLSTYLEAKLRDVGRGHACVGRIAGRGLYFCVDLVDAAGNPIVTEDRDTGFVGDIAAHPNHVIARECAKRGLYLGGFVPNTIKVAPPFTITEEEIDFGIGVFDEALAVIDRQIGINRSRA
jgi:4-aminobutyrate aminotransferase-like enzyme